MDEQKRKNYLAQVKVSADDIAIICKEGVEHEENWPTIRSLILRKIKHNDDMLEMFGMYKKNFKRGF